MKTAREVYEDWVGRRKGILRALTSDSEKLWTVCDPNKENLCLYGYPDGTWAVDLPAEEVPPEAPEPTLGINFARDGMPRKDWLGLLAVHSDCWLMSHAFYKGARLVKEGRAELFALMNKMPTCYEVVSGRTRSTPGAQHGPGGPNKRPGPGPGRPAKVARVPSGDAGSESDTDSKDKDSGGSWSDGEGEPCPLCGRAYRTEEFWIACDQCDTWYCGRCAKMTQSKAEKTPEWLCTRCTPA